MIRFSCSDYTFPKLPRAKRFALLQLLGFKYVDIGLFERSPDLRPSQLLASPRAFTKKLQSDLKQSGLQASDVFLQTGEDPAVSAANDSSLTVRSRNRKTFLRALDLCASLGCTHLTGLPGVWHKGTRKADDLALAVEEACWRQCVAADAGVSYAIEAHVGSICVDVASTRTLLDCVPGLTLTLDYGHFVSAGIDSRAIHSLVPFASHIHARGGAHNRPQAPVRENAIDFAGMIKHLQKQRYKGFIAIEYVWVDWMECDRTDNVSETLLLHGQLMKSIKLNSHQNLK
jgi:sugar phosphate isomerase/epimerase